MTASSRPIIKGIFFDVDKTIANYDGWKNQHFLSPCYCGDGPVPTTWTICLHGLLIAAQRKNVRLHLGIITQKSRFLSPQNEAKGTEGDIITQTILRHPCLQQAYGSLDSRYTLATFFKHDYLIYYTRFLPADLPSQVTKITHGLVPAQKTIEAMEKTPIQPSDLCLVDDNKFNCDAVSAHRYKYVLADKHAEGTLPEQKLALGRTFAELFKFIGAAELFVESMREAKRLHQAEPPVMSLGPVFTADQIKALHAPEKKEAQVPAAAPAKEEKLPRNSTTVTFITLKLTPQQLTALPTSPPRKVDPGIVDTNFRSSGMAVFEIESPAEDIKTDCSPNRFCVIA